MRERRNDLAVGLEEKGLQNPENESFGPIWVRKIRFGCADLCTAIRRIMVASDNRKS